MPTQYTEIDTTLLDTFLRSRGFVPVPSNTKALVGSVRALETVYGKRVDRHGMKLSIRVYSSNELGLQRDCGKDAIRVQIVAAVGIAETPDPTPPEAKTCQIRILKTLKRVHRVEGWKKNLTKRIEEAEAWEPMPCHKCGAPMTVRKAKVSNREFLGCCRYPNCIGACSEVPKNY